MATPVTLAAVAKEAGVSLATASRAINGSANRTVRPELRERVLAAAEKLRYTPDANAQAMARGRTTTVGLIVHDIADPYFSAIASGVTAEAERAGLLVTLATTGTDPERELALVDVLTSQRPRALVLSGSRLAADEGELERRLTEFRESGGGVAVIGQPLAAADAVVVDNSGGATELATALAGIGYRRVAILAGPAGHRTAQDRTAAFAAAFAGTGGAVVAAEPGAFNRDGGHAAMTALIEAGTFAGPDAADLVFATSDLMAVGAMAAAREAGLEPGTDVGVAGFDDIESLRDVAPALTTVRLPLQDIGITALDLALSPAAADARRVPVGGEVLLRASTPPR